MCQRNKSSSNDKCTITSQNYRSQSNARRFVLGWHKRWLTSIRSCLCCGADVSGRKWEECDVISRIERTKFSCPPNFGSFCFELSRWWDTKVLSSINILNIFLSNIYVLKQMISVAIQTFAFLMEIDVVYRHKFNMERWNIGKNDIQSE